MNTEQDSLAQPDGKFFRRMRIVVASIMFLDAALEMWKPGFLKLTWVPWVAFGLYFLLSIPRQNTEPFSTYIRKPRIALTLMLLALSMSWFGHDLYLLFAKR
jgi:hypothetical protein